MNATCKFSIVTPTYNRAHLLANAYASLEGQTLRDLEWIVVDDGSTDDTREVVQALKAAAPFSIHYLAQANSGKHVAVNRGVGLAKGFFIGILDSDDCYTEDAMARCWALWQQIPEAKQDEFIGLTALDGYRDGRIIGTKFPQDILDSDAIECRSAYRVEGDKIGFLRAAVLKTFPFPEDIGRFVPESLIWNRMAQKYRTRFINEVWELKEYRPDGLTANLDKLRVNSPRAAWMCCQELLASGRRLPLSLELRNCANFVRFWLHDRAYDKRHFAGIGRLILPIAAVLGAALYCRDRYRLQADRRGKLA
jgi:glycosyltransferase involved in cell wall biosynthesis